MSREHLPVCDYYGPIRFDNDGCKEGCKQSLRAARLVFRFILCTTWERWSSLQLTTYLTDARRRNLGHLRTSGRPAGVHSY
eukprot:760870-Pleurochrysis_carterae.AAC.1